MVLWTVVSRVLGLVRDLLMAQAYGLSRLADAFYVAWMLPNLFRRLFGEGALAAAFVPGYVRARERSATEASRVTQGVLAELLLALVLVAVLIEGGVALVRFGAGVSAPLLSLTALLAPYVVVVCCSAFLGAQLQAHGVFTPSAAAPVLLNLCWILALLVIPGLAGWSLQLQMHGIAVAILLGGLAGLVVHLLPLRSRKLLALPRWLPREPGVVEVRSVMAPALFGLAVGPLNVLADRGIAWTLVPGPGGVASLYYAFRLVHLPVALAGVSIAVAALPLLARWHAKGEDRQLGFALQRAIRVSLFASAPAAVGLLVVATPLTELLFARGAFDAAAVGRTASVLRAYAPSVVLLSLATLLVRALYAVGDARAPVRAGAWAVAVNVVGDLVLVFPLQEVGLALATSLAQLVNVALLLRALRCNLKPAALVASRPPTAAVLRPLLLSGVMGVVCWLAMAAAGAGRLLVEGLAADLAVVLLPVGVGVVFYLAVGSQLCRDEWSALVGVVRRRSRVS